MTTWSTHDDLCIQAYTAMDRKIGRHITGMQSDHHIQTFRFIGTHITLEEIQLIKTGLLRDILTEFDHFRIQLYAGDIGRLAMFLHIVI